MRIEIADLRQSGLSVRVIAHRFERAPSTISRQLWRNAVTGRGLVLRRSPRHCAAACRHRIDSNSELNGGVTELLLQRWSSQQISRHFRLRFAHAPSMWLCREGIYQAVYQPDSRYLWHLVCSGRSSA